MLLRKKMSSLSRRDFLKTTAALAAGTAFAGASRLVVSPPSRQTDQPNILIFVFDAMSARHLSLYGYGRRTTPHLETFAQRASVYHNHYSAGNFTTSGTASMLTGLHPWSHRAINYRGMIDRRIADRNLFHLLAGGYRRVAFTQNLWADILLSQFETDLEVHLSCDAFSQYRASFLQPDDLPSDRRIAYYVFQDFLNNRVDDPHPYPGSLFVGAADLTRALTTDPKHISAEYPRGLPTNHDFSYENPSVLEGLGRFIQGELTSSLPYLAYFHLWSPHEPYNARQEFVGRFPEDLALEVKPHHPHAGYDHSEETLRQYRREYDEYIADLDAEFGRLLLDLDKTGALQNSYVIVTSDHGELFERGDVGHATRLMYAPVTHIPLLISAPGQSTRSDVHSLTTNLDLLPTLLSITEQEIPAWVEGRILPGFGGMEDTSRAIFAMMAKDNPAFQPLTRATFTLIKGTYELFHYTGYPGYPDTFELYNLQDDPRELHDLFTKDITVASQMKDELLESVSTANRNFQKK
jgi:arylsulfatase